MPIVMHALFGYRHCVRTVVLFFLCILLPACSTPSFNDLLAAASSQAAAVGFSSSTINTQLFTLQVYSKVSDARKPLRIYLEGDGKSWVTRYRPSLNPTAHNPVALELALSDQQAGNVIYLGRPCHYRPTGLDKNCEIKYWTRESYSQVVVDNLAEAITALKQQYGVAKIELVGFSGGGALALLLAAQRDDVISVRTVAANIDVAAFIDYHNVSPMSGSLNPVNFATQLASIPQLHFSGEDDRVVPKKIAESYLSQLPNQHCGQLISLAGFSHQQGWQQRWPELLLQEPRCQ